MFRKVSILIGFVCISNALSAQVADTTVTDSAITNLPTIIIEESGMNQDDDISVSSSQNAAGVYFASQDPYLYMAGVNLGQFRFRPRGLDNMEIQVNGIQIQDLERGYATFGQLGGLNDVLKSRNATYGLTPSEYAFGSSNGINYIDARAINQRKGTTVSYNTTNRSYRNRIMATYNSGLIGSGWAYSLSASRRWAQEGYVPGTFYDGYSFYGAVTREYRKHDFNFTAFAAPTTRGQAVFAEIDDAYALANNNQYNSAWGYQNGEKRNSRVVKSFQPVLIASHSYNPSSRTSINTSAGYEFGKYASSYIDFFNAYNPNPDYYRNLPNYYVSQGQTNAAQTVWNQLASNPQQLQVNWDALYGANEMNWETMQNVNGSGDSLNGRRSMYVLSNRMDDMKKISFNSTLKHAISNQTNLYGGIKFISQDDEYYKQLQDLLGGDYFVNYNQFANQSVIKDPAYSQNDMNNPNRAIKVGDKYGYDYAINMKETDVWGQLTHTADMYEAFIAADGGYTSWSRTGYMKNGLFPDNSYGKSATHGFVTYRFKGGVNLKVNTRNLVYVHGGMFSDAPRPSNGYIAARNRDFIVNGLSNQQTRSLELGYVYKAENVFARFTGYVTDVTNATINKLFFNDDPAVNSFVNYILQGVNTRSTGIEFAGNANLSSHWTVAAIATTGQYFYTNTPTVSYYLDNSPDVTGVSRRVYMQNYYVAAGPQTAASVSLSYKTNNGWTGKATFNYFDNNYVDINPERRTQEAVDLVEKGTAQWHSIIDQEKMPSAYTIDLNVSKALSVHKIIRRLHNREQVFFSAGISNLLNNKDIKIAGYEQLRYDYTNRTTTKFPNKYDYAFGMNYYASINIRF